MALSDYLTEDEWDACYYRFRVAGVDPDFGTSMRNTITSLQDAGYKFSGLDENGNKKAQILGTTNPDKFVNAMMGGETIEGAIKIFSNGRNFLKKHCPIAVAETDEEWQELLDVYGKRD